MDVRDVVPFMRKKFWDLHAAELLCKKPHVFPVEILFSYALWDSVMRIYFKCHKICLPDYCCILIVKHVDKKIFFLFSISCLLKHPLIEEHLCKYRGCLSHRKSRVLQQVWLVL